MTTAPRSDRPGLYYPKLPVTWWLRRATYFRFMLRELSSVFVVIFLVVFLVQIYQLSRGPEAYAAFLETLRSPGWIIFHVVALAFALYHTVTWFNVAGVVQVVRLGERQLPPKLVVAANYGAWAVITVILAWFLLKG